ncbi:MAG: hypothetical protein LUD24_00955 [Phascolarctobacterium sp.]|nr:hypothetical protein [Phascolarctobacterium sp.]
MNNLEEILLDNGFEPWEYGDMQGWHRHTDFIKDCMVGEIARYSADDFIVTKHNGIDSAKFLRKNWQSKGNVMKHRFLFLDSDFSKLYVKSYWLGLKGWLEILHYREGDKEKRFADLIYLIELQNAEK